MKNTGFNRALIRRINPRTQLKVKKGLKVVLNELVKKREGIPTPPKELPKLPAKRKKKEITKEQKITAIKHYYEKKYGELFGVDMLTECKLSRAEIRYVLKNDYLHKYVWRAEKGKWDILSTTHIDTVYMILRKTGANLVHDKRRLA